MTEHPVVEEHQTRVANRQAEKDARRDRLTGAAIFAAIILSVLGILWLMQANDQKTEEADGAKQTAFVTAAQMRALCARVDVPSDLLAYCNNANQIVKDGAAGPPGPPPTAEQIYAAVTSYCSDVGCRGEDGTDGKPGPGPTKAQVLEAVTAFCGGSACQGVAGADGADGAPGPGPTSEQIAAAVSDYCADGRCKGADGADGKNGEDGRGISSVACESGNATFVITYTDGTKQTVQCQPNPEPTQ